MSTSRIIGAKGGSREGERSGDPMPSYRQQLSEDAGTGLSSSSRPSLTKSLLIDTSYRH